ncbi:hypothetical protein BZARG_2641 [Bizionia argentinensis JUB59]|uniref:Uncharacterized protein n=1 Tax=Bizionia argentinensis JUB59 TaxID=1046627 RepID=G2ED98_9FLAO|nr:hypothetical protein [Bizionia argentinensis]EGV43586.1 hypothetical protein BZARG_2641 [Bizionia argentinensis JUB59]
MAYLTKHTYSKLSREIDLKTKVSQEVFQQHILKDYKLYLIFNSVELKYLFNFKLLFENDKEQMKRYLKYVPAQKDTKKYVFEIKGKLKYHLSSDCWHLNKDFLNYNIPQEIRDLGDAAIEDYRRWFKAEGFAEQYLKGELDVSIVVFRYNNIFPFRYGVARLNEKYKLIEELPNSSIKTESQQFNYDAFLRDIEGLKKEHAFHFQSRVTRILSKFDYLLYRSDSEIVEKITDLFTPEFITNYGMDRVKELFTISKRIKKALMKALIDYFKWTYKSTLNSIDTVTLENFGLECCRSCKENKTVKR